MCCCFCSSSQSCCRATLSSFWTSSSLVSTTHTRLVRTLITSLRFCNSSPKTTEKSLSYVIKENWICIKSRKISFWSLCPHHPNGHTSAPRWAPSGGLAPRRKAAYDGRQPWCSAPCPGPSAQPSAAGAPSSASGWWSHSGHSRETFAHRETHKATATKTQPNYTVVLVIELKELVN